MSEVEKVSSVEQMLAELPDSYAFCIDAIDADLEKWANDVDGTYISDVREAAAEMATTSLDPPEDLCLEVARLPVHPPRVSRHNKAR